MSNVMANVVVSGLTVLGGTYLAWKVGKTPPSGRPWDEKKWPELTQRVRLLEKKMNIGTGVELREEENQSAQWSNLVSGKSAILLDPSILTTLSPEEQDFLIAHELGHYKIRNLTRAGFLFSLALAWVPSIALPILFPGISQPLLLLPIGGLCWLSYCINNFIFSRWNEQYADFAACSACGEKGGVRFFTKLSLLPPQQGHRLVNFLFNRLDPHPSPQSRIAALQNWAKSPKVKDLAL